jgi:hypothetical protein
MTRVSRNRNSTGEDYANNEAEKEKQFPRTWEQAVRKEYTIPLMSSDDNKS